MKEKSRHYAVKELADLAGISRRTLHYYDRIGLLKPSERGSNRYRYYDKDSLLYLQQILFYRELGMNLTEIKYIIRQSDFDVIQALHSHKTALLRRVERLNELIDTVGKTIMHLTGGNKMRKKDIFKGFSEEEQEKYAEEAREKYDSRLVDESMKRWKSYSPEKQKEIPHNYFLCTTKEYDDFEVKIEAKFVGEGANSGLLHTPFSNFICIITIIRGSLPKLISLDQKSSLPSGVNTALPCSR